MDSKDLKEYNYRKLAPTMKHRPIMTWGILGTVYGISPSGEVKYFDYDWDGALKFAGVGDIPVAELDLRYSKPKSPVYLPGYDMWNPEKKIGTDKRAYWVLGSVQPD